MIFCVRLLAVMTAVIATRGAGGLATALVATVAVTFADLAVMLWRTK